MAKRGILALTLGQKWVWPPGTPNHAVCVEENLEPASCFPYTNGFKQMSHATVWLEPRQEGYHAPSAHRLKKSRCALALTCAGSPMIKTTSRVIIDSGLEDNVCSVGRSTSVEHQKTRGTSPWALFVLIGLPVHGPQPSGEDAGKRSPKQKAWQNKRIIDIRVKRRCF